MTDPIADMLTRVRNAQMVKKSEVVIPYSKIKFNLLTLLAEHGWVGEVEKIEPLAVKTAKFKNKKQLGDISPVSRFTNLKIKLKYKTDKTPHISSLKRISKPGRRVYVDKEHIPFVLNGKGISVISTSQGLLSDEQARKKKIGGEVLCEIY